MPSVEKQAQLLPILLVNFVGTLGFSIVLPFLIFLVMKFGGNAIVYGLLAATYPAFQLIGAPVLGKWSDIYGRKKVLLLSNAGTSVGWILFLFALYLPVGKVFSIYGPNLREAMRELVDATGGTAYHHAQNQLAIER